MVDIFAFPTPEYVEMANQTWGGSPVRHKVVSSGGMTLRDWFAANAPEPSYERMATEYGIDRSRNPHNDSYKPPIRSEDQIKAQLAYRYADAMLAAREQKA